MARRCGCPFCCNECDDKSYPFCSPECKDKNGCTLPHSKCPIPDCNSRKKPNFADAETRQKMERLGTTDIYERTPYYPQPFCEQHLPKCPCGKSRFTAGAASVFSDTCLECYLACNIPKCRKKCFFRSPNKDALFGFDLSFGCYDHDGKTHCDPVWDIQTNAADLIKNYEFLREHPIYPMIRDMKLLTGKTLDEYQAMCFTSYHSCTINPANAEKFCRHAGAVAILRGNADRYMEKLKGAISEIISELTTPIQFRKRSRVFVHCKSPPHIHEAKSVIPMVISESLIEGLKCGKTEIQTTLYDSWGNSHKICIHDNEKQAILCHDFLASHLQSYHYSKGIFDLTTFKCLLHTSHRLPGAGAAAAD